MHDSFTYMHMNVCTTVAVCIAICVYDCGYVEMSARMHVCMTILTP